MNVLNSIVSIKKNICLWAVHEHKYDTIKTIVDALSIDQDVLCTIPGAQSLTATYVWPGTTIDQTPQVTWMLAELISFTEFRKHYYTICDYYGPCSDECCINIRINMSDSPVYISINVPTGLVNISSSHNSIQDAIVFNIVDVSRYVNRVSGNILNYASLNIGNL